MPADVTVVMPAMNRAHLIGPALDSVRRQSLQPSAVVVVDDGSTDDTASVAREHGARVIQLQTNGGSGPARNLAIKAAETEWIAFLDSDDLWLPDHLERIAASLDHDVIMVTAPARTNTGGLQGNATGGEIPLTPRKALLLDLICTSGTVARRDALLGAGLFRDLRRAQDMDLWIRVLEQGPGVALAEPTVVYQSHDQQAILDTDLMYSCVDQIIAGCRETSWFRRGDADRAVVRRRWDLARQAQVDGSRRRLAGHLGWIVARPHTWRTLSEILAQRRSVRRKWRSSALVAGDR